MHSGEKLTNITRRVKFYERLTKDPYIFLPYTIKDDMRADQLANYYYGDSNLVWMIYLANNIIDPLNEWPLTSEEFYGMIIKKYASQSGLSGFDVVNWSADNTTTENIMHYTNVSDPDIQLSKDTYALAVTLDPSFIASEWQAYRYYEYELDKNESKRSIQLIDQKYVKQVEKEFKSIMNG